MKNCVKIIVAVAVTVLFISTGYSGAYSPSDFTDVFTNPKLMSYCSQSSSINGVAGQSGVCAGGLYYYTETVSGFQDMNNPNNPKRLCAKDTACSPDPQVMYLGGSYRSVHSSDGKVPPIFRIYIPPGTMGISMSLYVPQLRVATVVRMGQPPANPVKPVSEYQNIQTAGLLLNDVMNGGDLWVRNGDGCIITFSGGGGINQNILQSKDFSDRWLYVQVVNYDNAWLETLSFSLTIGDMVAYKAWYNSVNWDCYNNPGNCNNVTVNFVADPVGAGTFIGNNPQTVSKGGQTTSVTASPDCSNNYRFVNWTDQNGTTVATTAALLPQTVTSAMIYTAHFTQQQQPSLYTVNASANPTAGGSVIPGSQTVTQGGVAVFTAIPKPGYKFVNWAGTGCIANSTASTVATVSNVTSSNVICTASFAALTHYTITSDTSKGSVSQTSAYEGESVSAIPNSGYRFVSWTGANTSANPLTLSASTTTATTITANFEPVATFSMLSSSGTLSASNGNSITATPNSADYSVKWTYPNGSEVPSDWVTTSPDGKSTITIPSQTAYVANFYKAPHTVTLSVEMITTTTPPTPAGTFYADGKILSVDSDGKASVKVPDNGSFIVTVIPKDGKKFSRWMKTDDTAFNSTANPLIFTNVTSNMEFIPILDDVSAGRYTVNFISGVGGTISGSASQTVLNNAYFNPVIAVANCGYKFSYWKEDPADGTTPTNLLNLPELELVVNKNKKYTAVFVPVVDPTNDDKLGLEEVIYILQVLSGVRP